MPRFRVPYVVRESPSFHHSMPGDDLTPVPTTYHEEVDAADPEEAKTITKQRRPYCTEIGEPELIK